MKNKIAYLKKPAIKPRKTAIISIVKNLSGLLYKTSQNFNDSGFIFYATLIFMTALWVLNPGNKFIAASFFLLIPVYYLRLKDFKTAAFLTYIVSTVVFTGKNYPQQILPPGILPLEIYPFGFFVNFTITPGLLILGVLGFVLLRDLLTGQFPKLNARHIDIFVILIFAWPVAADLIASKDPDFSLLFSLTSATSLIFYFFVKLYAPKMRNILVNFLSAISALIVFESAISLEQYLQKSPVFKNLEFQVNIEYFGSAGDEILFAFRPIGTFVHANALGGWLAAVLLVSLLLFLVKPKLQNALVVAVGFAALTMTLSRSAWLGFFCGTISALWILEKVRKTEFPKMTYTYIKTFLIMVFFLGLLFIFPRLEKSTNIFSSGGGYFREVQMRRAVDSVKTNPIFGVGTARSVQEGLRVLDPRDRDTSIVQNIHNWYVLNVIEHGLVYLIIFALLIILYIRKFIKNLRNKTLPLENINGIIQLGLFGGLISTLVAGFFQPFLNLTFTLFALAVSEIKIKK